MCFFLQVQGRFCYPYYSQIHWYVIEKYSQCLTDLANSREPDIKRNCRSEEYSYPPGKWVESVSLSRFPADKFRVRSSSLEKETTLPSPYIAACEREGLNNLIQKMKAGLFLSDAPDRVVNPHSLLSLLETQLQLRTLCSATPNGVTVLNIAQEKEKEVRNSYPCKLEAKKQEVAKQGDYEVFDIIKEFFGGDEKGGGNYGCGEDHLQRMTHSTCASSTTTKQTVTNGNQEKQVNKLSHIVNQQQQLDHAQQQLSHTHHQPSPPQQVDNSKMIEDLMKNTFGDKPQLGTGTGEHVNEDQMTTLLSELTADHMIQSLLTPLATVQKPSGGDTGQVTAVSTPPIDDHVISGNNHMIPNLVAPPPTTHATPTTDNHMRSTPATPTIDIPTLPNIPNLTPDHMTQLLDHVNMISGLVLPGLSSKTNSDDDSLSKIVNSSLDLLSPSPSSTSLPFVFPSTATPSVSSLATPPSNLSLTNQLDRNILSSLNPSGATHSPQTPLLHAIGPITTSSTGILSPSKPTSLLINPISSDNGAFSLTTPTGSIPSPSCLPKEIKKNTTKPSGGRKSRSNSKSMRKQASRKSRCGKCEGCKRSPCGECKFCLDSVRMGGFGKLKKACIQRRCSNVRFL